MRVNTIRVILFSGLLTSFTAASAQTFQSKVLKDMAGNLTAPLTAEVCKEGVWDYGEYNGKAITGCADANGQVTHLGYKLFTPDIKTLFPSDVYNFLERYALQMSMIKDIYEYELKLKDDKIQFLTGSMDTFKKITPETPFSINRVEDKGYNVVWTDAEGSEVLSVLFPIQFELLLGMPKVEIEKKMKELIAESARKVEMPSMVIPDTEAMADGIHKSKPAYHYELESVNTSSYYEQKDGSMVPVFSVEHKDYSAANLFLTNLAWKKDYKLYIEQSLYGGEKQNYTIAFTDWLAYCATQKLTVYFSVEEEREDGLKCLIIAQNKDLGYNHMLSVVIPDNFIEKSNAVLKAKFNAFIPTQNVKTLYGQYQDRPKKRI